MRHVQGLGIGRVIGLAFAVEDVHLLFTSLISVKVMAATMTVARNVKFWLVIPSPKPNGRRQEEHCD